MSRNAYDIDTALDDLEDYHRLGLPEHERTQQELAHLYERKARAEALAEHRNMELNLMGIVFIVTAITLTMAFMS